MAGKVRKQFILNPGKIKRARKVLGATSDTEAIDEALNIVIASSDINNIHKQLAGRCKIKDMDQSKF